MSSAVVAGWATSSAHGVSVVPITQYSSHGMRNSTDFSVLVITPVAASARMRSRGTVMWAPLEASTSRPPSASASSCCSWVHTPRPG